MSVEEIDYWLKLFSDNNHTFMSKDGKKITLFKVFDKLKELQQKNQELKKQLEEYDRKLFITKNELDMRQKSIDNKLNQQKEFIEMLEKEILDSKAGSSQQYYTKEHLRLFKEIIGGKDE